MNKFLLKCVMALLILGAPSLSLATPESGWWEVRNTDQSAAGSTLGWNVCIKPNGKWYLNPHGSTKPVRGDWVVLDDTFTMFLGIAGEGTPRAFAGAFMMKKINRTSMSGVYIYSNKALGSGKAFDALLTYKGTRCAPMKKVNAPVVIKRAQTIQKRTWQRKTAQKQTAPNEYDMTMSNDYTGSNMCLMARGSVVWLRRCTRSSSDLWAVVPSGKNFLIKNKNSGQGRCLGVRQNGLLFVSPCRPDLKFHLWTPEYLKGSPERMRLRNKFTGSNQCLAVSSQSGRNTPMVLPCGNYAGQKWY